MNTQTTLDNFTRAYIGCALWSSTDDNGEPLDKNHSIHSFAPEALEQMIADCAAFQVMYSDLLEAAYQLYTHSSEWTHEEQAGHDFWLTRNRRGAGFWDRNLSAIGRQLTEAAHSFGSCDLVVGDDGRIYA